MEEIQKAVDIFNECNCPFELMHCNSTYPMKDENANLNMIKVLRETFGCKVGYSGHESGIQISVVAVALGASSIERHITLNRTMYGSDQSASLEPKGLELLVRDIRIIEKALGDGIKILTEDEKPIREKLSKPYWTKK
jgi:N-acetylneuraminate synthase